MMTFFSDPAHDRALAAALLVAMLAGPIGCFVVWRRMAYFGDSLAHSALFGVGLGLLFHFDIGLGAIAAAVLLAILLLMLRRKRGLATDTLLGVLSQTGLALGLLTYGIATGENHEHMDVLFGDISAITGSDLLFIAVGAAFVAAAMLLLWRGLIAISVNEELARAEGVPVVRVELAFILLLAVITASAMKVVGLLLITALLIIPAAAARRLSASPEGMAALAALFAVIAAILGLILSVLLGVSSGPAVVVAAGAIFGLTLAVPESR